MRTYIITTERNEEYLKHHGILGMHWGDRNGPPYPLDASDHSASERREGTRGWTREAKRQAPTGKAVAVRKVSTGSNTKSKANRDTDTGETKKKGLTDKQKTAIKIGAGVAAAALVAYGAYRLNKAGKLDGVKAKGATALAKLKNIGKSGTIITKDGIEVVGVGKSVGETGLSNVIGNRPKGNGFKEAANAFRSNAKNGLNKGISGLERGYDNVAGKVGSAASKVGANAKLAGMNAKLGASLAKDNAKYAMGKAGQTVSTAAKNAGTFVTTKSGKVINIGKDALKKSLRK